MVWLFGVVLVGVCCSTVQAGCKTGQTSFCNLPYPIFDHVNVQLIDTAIKTRCDARALLLWVHL